MNLSKQLAQFGVRVERRSDGVWYIVDDENNPANRGKKLYEKYHTGGVVGGGIKPDEEFALLQKGEWVLQKPMVDALSAQIDLISALSKKWSGIPDHAGQLIAKDLTSGLQQSTASVPGRANNTVQITVGDTTIYGADDTTVKRHAEISRNMVNEIARQLKQKW